MAKHKVLGKGLSALIQGAGVPMPGVTGEPGAGQDTAGRVVREVPVGELAVNPEQPRKTFKQDKLEELAASLKDVGVLQPVLVRALRPGEAPPAEDPDGVSASYIIVAGERRVRAARLAGLETVPVLTCSYEETEALRVALLENIQRENLGPIEEAQAYQGLLNAYGATQEELAAMLGKNRSTVANAIRLLGLEDEIRELVESGMLSRGHAKALLSVPSGEQRLRLARLCRSRGLSVREVERRAQGAEAARHRARRQRRRGSAAIDESREVRALRERAESHFGSPVTIDRDAQGKGQIKVSFFDDDDLVRVLAAMGIETELG